MKNRKLTKILAGLDLPVMANYIADEGIPAKTVVTKLQCEACDTQVIANETLMPICPCCAGSMKAASKNNQVLSQADMNKLHPLGTCESCDTKFVTNVQTLASLQNQNFNCLICSAPVSVESDESDENADADANTTPSANMPADNADSDNDGDDTKDAPDNSTDGDKELQDVLKKMGVGDDSGNSDNDNSGNSDDSKAAKKPDDGSTETTSSNDDSDDDDEDDNDGNEDDEDEDDSVEASDVFRANLKNAKKFSVIPTESYDKWFLFADEVPLAVSTFNNADDSVKKVFRGKDFVTAFNSALAADGGVNEELVKDFGFEPIQVDVKLDDVSKQIIKDKVNEKTKDLNERLASLSSLYEQCIGTAALGISKGIYTKGDKFRTALVAKLKSNNVRDADSLVDDYLARELPGLMRSIVAQASELMKKSADAIEEAAEMVGSAAPRSLASKSNSESSNSNVVPLAVLSSAEFGDNKIEEKGNFSKTVSKSKLPYGLTAGLQRRV